jgi:hypothetical protein
MAEVLRRFEV